VLQAKPDAKPTITCKACRQYKTFPRKAWEAWESQSAQRPNEWSQLAAALNQLVVVDSAQAIDVDHADGPRALQEALGETLARCMVEIVGLQRVNTIMPRVVDQLRKLGPAKTTAVVQVVARAIERLATPARFGLDWSDSPDAGDLLVLTAAEGGNRVDVGDGAAARGAGRTVAT
jgi:hypothetical protein